MVEVNFTLVGRSGRRIPSIYAIYESVIDGTVYVKLAANKRQKNINYTVKNPIATLSTAYTT